jgi:hypothetical protein
MNAEIFGEWLRRQGHRVIRTSSSYWYNAGPRVFQAFPYHWVLNPSEQELRKLLLQNNAIALRYSTDLDAPRGKISYHTVCEDSGYNLASLRRQTRQNVRRGLGYGSIERIPMSRLAAEGWKLQQDTMDRQGRGGSMSEAEWQRICRAGNGLPGLEAWGAVVDGELAASLLTVRVDDVCDIPYAQSHRKFLSKYVNNALFFAVTREMLSRPGLKSIFFNVQSLDASESVDEFKFRMNFTAKPVRQCVDFNPLMRPFANGLAYKVVKELLRRFPASYTLGKAEGMLRFHLQGRRPPDEQNLPEFMVDRNADLFKQMDLSAESRKQRA